MTPREFQIEFERRLQMIDSTLKKENKLSSDQLFSILNEAKDKFYITRYTGINYKQKGFEQDQKRIDDLRTLVKTKKYSDDEITAEDNRYSVEFPEDYVILLGDTAGISPLDGAEMPCWTKVNGEYVVKYSDTLESTIETVDRQLENSLSEHRLRYCLAKPLRLIEDNNIILITDGNYKVSEYKITYLSKPSDITIDNATVEYTDLPEHTHMEIVKLAVQLFLSTKATNNYQIYSNEVASME